jgi:hypothetical protein
VITHLIILRASDVDPDGANVQVKLGQEREPSRVSLDECRSAVVDLFTKSFGRLPERVGVAVLPYVNELDEEAPIEGDAECVLRSTEGHYVQRPWGADPWLREDDGFEAFGVGEAA